MMNKVFDKVGLFFSGLCLVHCLVLPVFLILFPVLKHYSFFQDKYFHDWMFLFVLIPALLSFGPHFMKTKNLKTILLPVVAIVILFFTNILFHQHGLFETIVTSFASMILMYAHYKHLKSKHCCH